MWFTRRKVKEVAQVLFHLASLGGRVFAFDDVVEALYKEGMRQKALNVAGITSNDSHM